MPKEISLYRTTLFGGKLESKQLRKKERRKAYDFLYLFKEGSRMEHLLSNSRI
jgi:hypothetical protein